MRSCSLGAGSAWPRRNLLSMAAGKRLDGGDRLVSRCRRPVLIMPMGDRSVRTFGHSLAPRRRRGAAPAPRIGPKRRRHQGLVLSRSRGAGVEPLRRRGVSCSPGVRTLLSPDRKGGRHRERREAGSRSRARRLLAAMPSKFRQRHARFGPEEPGIHTNYSYGRGQVQHSSNLAPAGTRAAGSFAPAASSCALALPACTYRREGAAFRHFVLGAPSNPLCSPLSLLSSPLLCSALLCSALGSRLLAQC